MALTNAENQARWRARRAAELKALRDRAWAPEARVPAGASIGQLIEALIVQLRGWPAAERAKAIVHLARRLGIEVEEGTSDEVEEAADSELHGE
jgi:hypothetical protein